MVIAISNLYSSEMDGVAWCFVLSYFDCAHVHFTHCTVMNATASPLQHMCEYVCVFGGAKFLTAMTFSHEYFIWVSILSLDFLFDSRAPHAGYTEAQTIKTTTTTTTSTRSMRCEVSYTIFGMDSQAIWENNIYNKTCMRHECIKGVFSYEIAEF